MRRFVVLIIALLGILALATPGAGVKSNGDASTGTFDNLKLSAPITATSADKIDTLSGRTGSMTVSIRLSEPAVAEGGSVATVQAQQSAFLAGLDGSGAAVLGSVQKILNAVFVEIDAAQLSQLASDASVYSIREVGSYEIDLSETVPYIGAAAVQDAGVDGAGIKVAVLDSGIDYLHANLGGSGDPDEFAANDPNIIEPGSFPTAKVVGGTDFVGSAWLGADGPPEAPDDDPLDDGLGGGHGTHVADIIGGAIGVAPGADLYAVKVCSSVSTACSGIALIQGMEWAVNAEVDIINMSLGSPYGQAFDDDLSAAVDNATALGVLTVASAGNSSDKPYIVGSPSAAPTALSVAQTQVPSAELQLITIDDTGADYPAVFQSWSVAPTSVLTGAIQYGDTDGDNLDGCAPFDGDLTGLVVLVDRGACNFSLKVSNVSQASGLVGIIGLVAPGEPFDGGDGGDRPIDIPGYMIDQANANAFKAAAGTPATVDPDNGLPLIGQMVGGSSRGPTMQFNSLIKPEIGAPGASVSAIAGTGTGEGAFGGTSGAAPMVTGSAALLLSVEGSLTPAEVKARLINTGDTDIDTDPFSGLAPITRIGGGEVRADRAVASAAAALEADALQGALSFGFVDASADGMTLTKTIQVQNYGSSAISYDIAAMFRYASDATGAVTPSVSESSITVPAGGSYEFDLTLTINGSELSTWYGNSGDLGADPGWLTDLEFDGYVMLDAADDANDIHLPWHVLPRKSGDVSVDETGKGKFTVSNQGAGGTLVRAYNLIATSPNQPEGDRGANAPISDFRALGYATYRVPAGYCGPTASYVIEFAVNTWERQTHANAPLTTDIFLDYDGDGVFDGNVFNYEITLGDLSDGRNLTWAIDYATGAMTAFFFTDHQTNSANTVLTVCAEQIGLKGGEVNQAKVYVAGAYDNYFTGDYTDFGSALLGAGAANSPVTFQGNNSVAQYLPAGASVKGTFSGAGDALFLFTDAPEGNEAVVLYKK